jgi:hypothetical protein
VLFARCATSNAVATDSSSVIGTSLVFAMTLLMAGLANGFGVAADYTLDTLGARRRDAGGLCPTPPTPP